MVRRQIWLERQRGADSRKRDSEAEVKEVKERRPLFNFFSFIKTTRLLYACRQQRSPGERETRSWKSKLKRSWPDRLVVTYRIAACPKSRYPGIFFSSTCYLDEILIIYSNILYPFSTISSIAHGPGFRLVCCATLNGWFRPILP